MPESWTAEIIGQMHMHGFTAKQLAEEVGWTPEYVSYILNGHRNPKDAEVKLKKALLRLEIRKERREKGLSDDLEELIKEQTDKEYADKLREVLGIKN